MLTGPWYEDTFRVGVFLIVFAVPCAALGADVLFRRVALAWRRRSVGGRTLAGTSRARTLAAAAFVVLLIPATQITVSHDAELTRQAYVLADDSELISPNEIALLERIGDEVPPDAVIADNPWDGSALAWALTGRRVLSPHLLYRTSPSDAVIARHLREAVAGGDVCAAARELGVGYILDFGRYAVDNPGAHEYPGLDDLASSDAVVEIDREGDAVLYRLTACD